MSDNIAIPEVLILMCMMAWIMEQNGEITVKRSCCPAASNHDRSRESSEPQLRLSLIPTG